MELECKVVFFLFFDSSAYVILSLRTINLYIDIGSEYLRSPVSRGGK